jgi:glycerol-3-phosphate acyltransferase PlsY
MDNLGFVLAALGGYLLGSIPFGLLLTRMAGLGDIRQIGSHGIGATNVLRTGRKGLAAATVLADILKGTVAVLVMAWLGGPNIGLLAGAAAFFGHLFPVWLGFKGGKGIATGVGVLLAISWKAALAAALIWIAIAAATRYSSLASLIASAAAPVILYFIGTPPEVLTFLVLAIATFVMHRGNIVRLWQGSEGKIGQKAPRAA